MPFLTPQSKPIRHARSCEKLLGCAGYLKPLQQDEGKHSTINGLLKTPPLQESPLMDTGKSTQLHTWLLSWSAALAISGVRSSTNA